MWRIRPTLKKTSSGEGENKDENDDEGEARGEVEDSTFKHNGAVNDGAEADKEQGGQ